MPLSSTPLHATSFVVPQFHHRQSSTESWSFSAAAVAVLKMIQMYYNHVDDLPGGRFISLPHLSADPHDGKSWYFLNAAMSNSYCIVGLNNVIEILPVLLRRPWCILELCCTKLESTEASQSSPIALTGEVMQ